MCRMRRIPLNNPSRETADSQTRCSMSTVLSPSDQHICEAPRLSQFQECTGLDQPRAHLLRCQEQAESKSGNHSINIAGTECNKQRHEEGKHVEQAENSKPSRESKVDCEPSGITFRP